MYLLGKIYYKFKAWTHFNMDWLENVKIPAYLKEMIMFWFLDHNNILFQLEGDLAELQAKSAASEESVKKVKEQLQPLQDRLLKINDQYSDIYKVQTKIGQNVNSFLSVVIICVRLQ